MVTLTFTLIPTFGWIEWSCKWHPL